MFQGYFPVICTYQTFATFWVKRTQKLAVFLKLGSQTTGWLRREGVQKVVQNKKLFPGIMDKLLVKNDYSYVNHG